jgi:hypothetical protein
VRVVDEGALEVNGHEGVPVARGGQQPEVQEVVKDKDDRRHQEDGEEVQQGDGALEEKDRKKGLNSHHARSGQAGELDGNRVGAG